MTTPLNIDPTSIHDILIRGSDYLKRHPDFSLAGRTDDLTDLQTILMRKNANGVLLTGASGVGMTALALGLEHSKHDLKTPMDIVNLRFYWLDTDKLFESGDSVEIHQTFSRIRSILREDPQTVLIIENSGNFVDSARNSGNATIINALLGDVKNARYQCILETPYHDLSKVLKADSDMQSEFTLKEVKEPKGDALRAILKSAAPAYEEHHGIRISDEALETAAMLSEKYKTKELPAQPAGALALIDRSLSSYRLKAHAEPVHIQVLLKDASNLEAYLTTGQGAEHFEGRSRSDLETHRDVLKVEIETAQKEWDELQREFRRVYEEKRLAEEDIITLEGRIERENAKGTAKQGSDTLTKAAGVFDGFDEIETSEVIVLRKKIAERRKAAEAGKRRFEDLTEKVNSQLLLTPDHILGTFSKISGIPTSKLTQDEREKLLNLDQTLKSYVYGQDHAIDAIADAVRNARMGLQAPNKPEAAFLLQGPSGAGKTEVVKSLARSIYDDESATLRLDMSEYMEKHSVARLIGAPPGYAGFEEGGVLTNEIERNPNRVILVDEIEKAHPDVFNLFLQILDDARVTSGQGITSRFNNTIIIMTTNIGAEHFLDVDVPFDVASKRAKDDLQAHFRNEFLNRFAGKENIIGFKRLEVDTLEKIAQRELRNLNNNIAGKGLSVSISGEDIRSICVDRHDPANGARAIPGYFARNIQSKISRLMLERPEFKGVVPMDYVPETHDVVVDPSVFAPSPANDRGTGGILTKGAKDVFSPKAI